jgi:FkbM family methyltransferase
MTKIKTIKEKFFFNKRSPFRYFYFFINKIISKFAYKKSFSQGSMDLILEHIFKNKNNGFYVDVGCQHPIKNNNTYLLYKRGWSGVNIDLDSVNIELFNFFRRNDNNVKSAVSDKIEDAKLFYYHQKSPINTLDKNISLKQNAKIEKEIDIQTNTLTNILDNYSIKKIDLLTIDVEGFELKVLKGLNFDKYNPGVIIVEFLDLEANKWEIPYNNLENVLKSEIYNYLVNKDYKLVNWVNGDLVFIKSNFKN